MKNFKKPIITMTVFASLALSLFTFNSTNASDSTSDSGSEGDTNNHFYEEHPSTVHCPDTRWTKTTYYNSSGDIVGIYLFQNGAVQSTYSGAYTSSSTASGGNAERNMTIIQCYGLGWTTCTPITGEQACE